MTFERWRRHRFPALLVIAAIIVYRGCATAPKTVEMPVSIGDWKLVDSHATGVTPNQDDVAESAATSRVIATYQAMGRIEVRLYRLKNSALGLDLVQKSRPSPDRVVFYRGQNFVAASQQDATPQALQSFASELNQRLAGD